VGASGSFALDAVLPIDLPTGAHDITLSITWPQLPTFALAAPFSVTAAQLAATGGEPSPWTAGLAVLMLLAGVVLVRRSIAGRA
jgi:LPXTG-motif cell wall-anchored protein